MAERRLSDEEILQQNFCLGLAGDMAERDHEGA